MTTLQLLVLRAVCRGVVSLRYERMPGVWHDVRVWRAIERDVTSQIYALKKRRLIMFVRCRCPWSKGQAYATTAGLRALRERGMI